ncbi:MAG: PKD domain-containing protein, partial [Cyclobacteriaceae bacterium]|nr:PKD domain-containing protein [Cyclobacteriaceae bacterium]
YGCTATSNKTVTIFDASNAIAGLENIQCTDGGLDIIENNGRAPQFLLIDLQVTIPIDQVGKFDPAVVSNSLSLVGVDYEFDPSLFNTPENYALFPTGEGGLVGTLLFTGQYQDQQNTSIIEKLVQRVDIYIPPVSTLTFDDLGPVGFTETEYCENGGDIRISGSPKPATGVSIGFFTINNDPAHPALTDNGDGSATIDPTKTGYGFIDVSYSFQNLTSSCENTVSYQVRVNPNPIAEFTILPGCVGIDFNFDNTSKFPPGLNQDPLSVINKWDWDFNDINSPNGSVDELATHVFLAPGTYNVSLTATSDKGCISTPLVAPISIGNNPATSFRFEQIAVGTPTIFTNTTPTDTPSTPPGSQLSVNVETLEWYINGVLEETVIDNNSDPELRLPFDTYSFTTAEPQQVVLRAITDKNCIVNDTLNFFTVPKYTLSNVDADPTNDSEIEDFSVDNGGWVTWGTNSSWGVGSSGGDVIATGINTTGVDNFWTTGVGSPHDINEISYVYSPVYNIADLTRPLLILDKFSDLQEINGVVIEYTPVNLQGTSTFGIDDSQWKLLGSLSSGINWYGTGDIENIGGDQTTGLYGWSLTDIGWTTSKHTLAAAKEASLTNGNGEIQFRVSFVSGSQNNSEFDGFAFDNVFVGPRTRTVLVENFTDITEATQNNDLNSFLSSDVDAIEIVKLNYHTSFLGNNPFAEVNSLDPDSRAQYYNINTVASAVMDGTIRQGNQPVNGWLEEEFNKRSLQPANFKITPSISKNTDEELVINTSIINTSSNPDATALNGTDKSALIYTVIVENEDENNSYYDIVRKILPDATGLKVDENQLKIGIALPELSWTPFSDTNISNLSVVVFIQGEETKEIYQTIKVPVDVILNRVTGIDNQEMKPFRLYPNPAKHYTQLDFGKRIEDDYTLNVYDQFGKLIFTDYIQKGQRMYELDTKNYINSLYIIQVESEKGIVERTKLVVLDK